MESSGAAYDVHVGPRFSIRKDPERIESFVVNNTSNNTLQPVPGCTSVTAKVQALFVLRGLEYKTGHLRSTSWSHTPSPQEGTISEEPRTRRTLYSTI